MGVGQLHFGRRVAAMSVFDDPRWFHVARAVCVCKDGSVWALLAQWTTESGVVVGETMAGNLCDSPVDASIRPTSALSGRMGLTWDDKVYLLDPLWTENTMPRVFLFSAPSTTGEEQAT